MNRQLKTIVFCSLTFTIVYGSAGSALGQENISEPFVKNEAKPESQSSDSQISTTPEPSITLDPSTTPVNQEEVDSTPPAAMNETANQSSAEPAAEPPAPPATTTTNEQPTMTSETDAVPPKLPVTKRMKHMFQLVWSTGIPLGSSNDYIADFGVLGMSFEFRYRVIPQFSVGALLGWNNFFDEVYDTATEENLTVTNQQNRWLSVMPLTATFHGYLTNSSPFLPYLGINLGGYFKTRIMDNGWWTESSENWHFGMAPELGVYFPASAVALILNVKYHYLIKTGEVPSEQFFGINFGVVFSAN